MCGVKEPREKTHTQGNRKQAAWSGDYLCDVKEPRENTHRNKLNGWAIICVM